MGLFNFWKKSGKSLDGGGEAAPQPAVLKKEVADLGLKADDVDIEVSGDKVVLRGGQSLTAEEREKVVLAVGNVAGVAEVEAEAVDTAVFHTVEKGDSLWKIAEKTLGNGARYKEIFEANRPMLSDPDKIYPGQVLRIPGGTMA